MWAANAATISPGADTGDSRLHMTPANLHTQFHRSIEAATTSRILRKIFSDEQRFAHHPSLPSSAAFSDEGAANHTRLWAGDGSAPGLEIFTYGRSGSRSERPSRYPARQSLEASQSIARLHGLRQGGVLFVRQNPGAIDAGAFHNDVVCVGHRNVLLFHELAFDNGREAAEEIHASFAAVCAPPLFLLEVPESELPLTDAVATYLFNSQLVTLGDDSIALIAPLECRSYRAARSYREIDLNR